MADEEPKKEEENLSIVDEAKKIRDEIKAENDRRENILKEEQKLRAENMLGSSAGGRPEQKLVSEADIKKQEALKFWEGTAIEDAIKKQDE